MENVLILLFFEEAPPSFEVRESVPSVVFLAALYHSLPCFGFSHYTYFKYPPRMGRRSDQLDGFLSQHECMHGTLPESLSLTFPLFQLMRATPIFSSFPCSSKFNLFLLYFYLRRYDERSRGYQSCCCCACCCCACSCFATFF